MRAAAVVLEMIDAPASEHLRVFGLVPFTARVTRAGGLAGTRVDAELHATLMGVVREVVDTAWEFLRIEFERMVPTRALIALPAVVQIDEHITGVAHAVGDHRINGFDDDLLV